MHVSGPACRSQSLMQGLCWPRKVELLSMQQTWAAYAYVSRPNDNSMNVQSASLAVGHLGW